jgi:hypothetical protein
VYAEATLIYHEEAVLLIPGIGVEESGIQKDVDDFRFYDWDLAVAFWQYTLMKTNQIHRVFHEFLYVKTSK